MERPLSKGDPRTTLADVARRITTPAPDPGEPWKESDRLKRMRELARRSPPGGRRQAWKEVWQLHRRERRAWMKRKVDAAARGCWGELRSLTSLTSMRQHRQWDGVLLAEPGWANNLREHFEGIFARVPASQEAMNKMREKLRGLCKQTPWKPFTDEELEATAATWGRRKATGTDGVALEALQTLRQHDNGRGGCSSY